MFNQCCDYLLFLPTIILALRELRARDWDETRCNVLKSPFKDKAFPLRA